MNEEELEKRLNGNEYKEIINKELTSAELYFVRRTYAEMIAHQILKERKEELKKQYNEETSNEADK
jgi:hypothetical protein